jgi:nucleoside diphosphate kinase
MTKASSFLITTGFLIMGLWGCSVAPSERTVAGAITAYFENTGYKVVELKIGKIEGMPLSEKTYMGTPGYVVEVVSITLEPEADEGTDIRKLSRLTFSDARIRVIQDRSVKDMWRVSIISGISLL